MINLMGVQNNVSITVSNLDASGISLASASLVGFQVIVFIFQKVNRDTSCYSQILK